MDHKFPEAEIATALDARMVRSRAALRDALLELLERKTLDQITVREITQTARIGYATFFRHFPDKETLLNDLAAQQIRDLLALALPVLYANDSRAACLALCLFVDEHRRLWSTLLAGGAAGVMREELLQGARTVAATHPQPDNDLPAGLKTVWAVGGVIDILTWWLQQDRHYPCEQIAEILDRLVVAPIMVPLGDSAG
jgi:AcrR family transcriptional regulator